MCTVRGINIYQTWATDLVKGFLVTNVKQKQDLLCESISMAEKETTYKLFFEELLLGEKEKRK